MQGAVFNDHLTILETCCIFLLLCRFWYNSAVNFLAAHFSGNRTYVLQVLESDGNTDLGSIFQLLLNLMVFFDKFKSGEWEDATSIMDNLALLPRTEKEIGWKVESFHALDRVIKDAFPFILLASVESLYQQHSSLKERLSRGNVGGVGSSTVSQKMYELRQKARVLVTFCALVNLSIAQDVIARVARM